MSCSTAQHRRFRRSTTCEEPPTTISTFETLPARALGQRAWVAPSAQVSWARSPSGKRSQCMVRQRPARRRRHHHHRRPYQHPGLVGDPRHHRAATTPRLGADVTVGHRVILHGCTVADAVLVGMGAICARRRPGGRAMHRRCRVPPSPKAKSYRTAVAWCWAPRRASCAR